MFVCPPGQRKRSEVHNEEAHHSTNNGVHEGCRWRRCRSDVKQTEITLMLPKFQWIKKVSICSSTCQNLIIFPPLLGDMGKKSCFKETVPLKFRKRSYKKKRETKIYFILFFRGGRYSEITIFILRVK